MSEVPLYAPGEKQRTHMLPTGGTGGWGTPRQAMEEHPLQGYLAHKKLSPLQDFRRALGRGLLLGPGRRQFLMSEVPL